MTVITLILREGVDATSIEDVLQTYGATRLAPESRIPSFARMYYANVPDEKFDEALSFYRNREDLFSSVSKTAPRYLIR